MFIKLPVNINTYLEAVGPEANDRMYIARINV